MHATITQNISSAINRNTLPQVLLFVGPRGSGKNQTAQHIISTLLNAESVENHPEYVHIEPEGLSISIDQIKQMLSNCTHTSLSNSKRVISISHIDKATISAGNALLKTIEEPPQNTYFILTAENIKKIPKTLLSRCTVIHMPHTTAEEMDALIEPSEPHKQKIITWASGRPEIAKAIVGDRETKQWYQQTAQELMQYMRMSADQRLTQAQQHLPKKHEEAREYIHKKADTYSIMLRALLITQGIKHQDLAVNITQSIATLMEAKTMIDKNVQTKAVWDICVLNLPKLNGNS